VRDPLGQLAKKRHTMRAGHNQISVSTDGDA
jgi:hypothetical protein